MKGPQLRRLATSFRAVEVVTGTAALLAAAWGGAWLSHWDRRLPETAAVSAAAAPELVYDTSKGFPRLNRPEPRDPREPEPRAVEVRAAVMRRDAAAIEAECQQAAGGDWDKWQKDTEPYRAALKRRIDALRVFPERAEDDGIETRYEALAANDNFPLFEIAANCFLRHVWDPTAVDDFRRQRPAVAVHRWLRQQGIDLIFVPAPRMTEVYLEHFLNPCPPDGVIAPHLRRTLLELLKEDVEVVDGLPLFRAVRDTDEEYLYNAGTAHWGPRAMRVMAREIAGRIERYKFGARARYALPIYKTSPGPFIWQGRLGGIGDMGYLTLSDEQRARAVAAQTTNESHVTMRDGRSPPNNPDSPVMVVGHCWVESFRDQLVKELNLLTATIASPSLTTEAFTDFLRDPKLLQHCRVVVWITTEQHITQFKPLPPPIAKTLQPDK
jgi:hypothetical protein